MPVKYLLFKLPGNGKPQDSSFYQTHSAFFSHSSSLEALCSCPSTFLGGSAWTVLLGSSSQRSALQCCALCLVISLGSLAFPHTHTPTHGRVIYTREICKHYKPDLFLPGNQTLNRCQCATAFEVQRRWGRRDRSKENLRTDADPIAHWESVCLLCSL